MIKKYILPAALIIALVLIIIWIIHGNTALEINTISVSSTTLPQEFDGFRIVQISDLHNAEFGKDNAKLISAIKDADADIIVITGDIIDSRRTNIDCALRFAGEAALVAPTYYVNGNHESRLEDTEYVRLKNGLEQADVTILENDTADVLQGDEMITLVGINDPKFPMELVDDVTGQNIEHQLMNVIPQNDNYKILLAHRPEYFDLYAGKVDLVFSGHAHGGQFIIPFVGGGYSPGQGFMPEYYDGIYEQSGTSMIVSRGIGNSIFPFRINNKPQIVVAELKSLRGNVSDKSMVEVPISEVEAFVKQNDGHLTAQEAEKLCGEVMGEVAEETGFPISYRCQGEVSANDKFYYVMHISWLVDNSHWSYIGNCFVSSDGREIYDGIASEKEYKIAKLLWSK